MSVKLNEKSRISSNLLDLIDDDFVVALELSMLLLTLKEKYMGFLMVFFHSSRNMKKIKHITCCPLC